MKLHDTAAQTSFAVPWKCILPASCLPVPVYRSTTPQNPHCADCICTKRMAARHRRRHSCCRCRGFGLAFDLVSSADQVERIPSTRLDSPEDQSGPKMSSSASPPLFPPIVTLWPRPTPRCLPGTRGKGHPVPSSAVYRRLLRGVVF